MGCGGARRGKVRFILKILMVRIGVGVARNGMAGSGVVG